MSEVIVTYAEKHKAGRYLQPKGRDSFPEKMQITGNNRGWLAETGSRVTAHTTIQSSRTVETAVDCKRAVSAGIFASPIRTFPSLGTLAVGRVDF